MIKHTLLAAACLLLASLCSLAQNPQLKKWYLNGYQVDMTTATPAITGTLPTGSTEGPYNGMYDAHGQLMFYITGNSLYDRYGIPKGSFYISPNFMYGSNSSYEPCIVPFLDNAPCKPQRYYVFYTAYYWSPQAIGKLHAMIVTVNDDRVSAADILDSTGKRAAIASADGGQAGLAVGKLVNGRRWLYYMTDDGLRKLPITAPTSPTDYGLGAPALIYSCANPEYATRPYEMDLSPDGTRLAWSELGFTNFNKPARFGMINLDANGDWNGTEYLFYVYGSGAITHDIRGIEFNDAGTRLYVASGASGANGDGIYMFNPANWTANGSPTTYLTYIPGTKQYGSSMIERGYNGLLYVSDGSHLAGINPANNSFPNSVLNIAMRSTEGEDGYTLPDQIDGNNYDAEAPLLYDYINYSPMTDGVWTPASNPVNTEAPTLRFKSSLSFTVPGTYTLQNMHIEFGEDAQLMVGRGVTLNLINTTLQGASQCGKMWSGVYVDGGTITTTTDPLPYYTDATTYKTIIKDAYAGITLSGESATGKIRSTLFDANTKHLVFTDALANGMSDAASLVYNCLLTHGTPLRDQSGAQGVFTAGHYYGKTGIDVAQTNTGICKTLNIAQNLFLKGSYGVTVLGASVKLEQNEFRDMYPTGVGVNVNMNQSRNKLAVSTNYFYTIANPIIAYNGAADIVIDYNGIYGSNFTVDALTVTGNKDCQIKIRSNNINGFTRNAILLHNNAGTPNTNQHPNANLSLINVTNNLITNTTERRNATGISIVEDGQTQAETYGVLNIADNGLSKVAQGILTYQVVGKQSKRGVFSDRFPQFKGSDIDHNTIEFFATYTPSQSVTDYNTGVQLNNSSQLSVVNNTISTGMNAIWRNMGVSSDNTNTSLIWRNTIKAGRGISARLNALDNNYYCNTFNSNVNGISLVDHALRAFGDVHGLTAQKSRDNTFNLTRPNGSDIELYVNTSPLQLGLLQNQWLFAQSPFTLIYPDPNAYFGNSPRFAQRQYINAGSAPDACASDSLSGEDNPPGGEHTQLPEPPEHGTPGDTLGVDTCYMWQWAYGYERQLKAQEAATRNMFMSQLIDLEQLIATADYEAAADVFNNMQADHPFGVNYLTVYHTLIDARYPVMRELTEDETNLLTNIARQYPCAAGPSVYVARGVLWAEKGLRFHDAETDRPDGIGAQVVWDGCYSQLPSDLDVVLQDENGNAYPEIPVIKDETNGKLYVTADHMRQLSPDMRYGFRLNYKNTNPGFMTPTQLYATADNTYSLCSLGKRSVKHEDGNRNTVSTAEETGAVIAKIYPNPSSSVLHIEVPRNETCHIEVYNLVGQQVYRQTTSEAIHLNIANFEHGVYLVKVNNTAGDTLVSERIAIMQ